jgi:hypothetical protein
LAGEQVIGAGIRLGRLRALAREFLTPASSADVNLSSSATINAQFWLNQVPWRPTAGWAAVAALLSFGWPVQPLALDWREIALVFLLVDPLWGSVWRLAAGRTELLPLHEGKAPRPVWLPYLQSGSPAAELLGWDARGVLPLLFRVALPTILLAGAVAWVLGMGAVWLTIAVVVTAVLGWIGRYALQHTPALLHSLVTMTLPWTLALSRLGLASTDERWWQYAALVGLWSVHNWGEGRGLRRNGDLLGIGLVAAADIGLGLLAVAARAPLWLALLSVLWLPTYLFVYYRRPWAPLNFWWLLAMLVSSMAIGQSRIAG